MSKEGENYGIFYIIDFEDPIDKKSLLAYSGEDPKILQAKKELEIKNKIESETRGILKKIKEVFTGKEEISVRLLAKSEDLTALGLSPDGRQITRISYSNPEYAYFNLPQIG